MTNSFPTRRSSDLLKIKNKFYEFVRTHSWVGKWLQKKVFEWRQNSLNKSATKEEMLENYFFYKFIINEVFLLTEGHLSEIRSEEHTSELQSLMRISYAVFCLKKKI